jgi:hypothetical protein
MYGNNVICNGCKNVNFKGCLRQYFQHFEKLMQLFLFIDGSS